MTLSGAANEAAKGLSAQPIFLLVAVINIIMIGALMYVAKSQVEERAVLQKYLIDCQRGAP